MISSGFGCCVSMPAVISTHWSGSRCRHVTPNITVLNMVCELIWYVESAGGEVAVLSWDVSKGGTHIVDGVKNIELQASITVPTVIDINNIDSNHCVVQERQEHTWTSTSCRHNMKRPVKMSQSAVVHYSCQVSKSWYKPSVPSIFTMKWTENRWTFQSSYYLLLERSWRLLVIIKHHSSSSSIVTNIIDDLSCCLICTALPRGVTFALASPTGDMGNVTLSECWGWQFKSSQTDIQESNRSHHITGVQCCASKSIGHNVQISSCWR